MSVVLPVVEQAVRGLNSSMSPACRSPIALKTVPCSRPCSDQLAGAGRAAGPLQRLPQDHGARAAHAAVRHQGRGQGGGAAAAHTAGGAAGALYHHPPLRLPVSIEATAVGLSCWGIPCRCEGRGAFKHASGGVLGAVREAQARAPARPSSQAGAAPRAPAVAYPVPYLHSPKRNGADAGPAAQLHRVRAHQVLWGRHGARRQPVAHTHRPGHGGGTVSRRKGPQQWGCA